MVKAQATPQISEAEWQRRVTDTATLYGWLWWHQRPARTEKGWRTTGSGVPGAPDLQLARAGEVHLIELKTDNKRSKPTAYQVAWLEAAGDHGHLWRPSDWPEVLDFLSTPTPTPERATT